MSWKLTDDTGQHSGSDFGTLANLIDDPSLVQELRLDWNDGDAEATILVMEELKACRGLRSLSLELDPEDDPGIANALAASLGCMQHLEQLSLGGFAYEEAISPLMSALPAWLRNLSLHHSSPESHACLVENLFTTPLPHLECLHLQCNEQLHDEDALKIWARLGNALVKWIPSAPSLCELSYPAEIRWAVSAWQLRNTLAKSPSLHDLRFSPDHEGLQFDDVDNNLTLVRPQLDENLDRLLRHPYGRFDPVCSAFMSHVLGAGNLASHDIAPTLQTSLMGRNTPLDRWRARALLVVCKTFYMAAQGRTETIVRLQGNPLAMGHVIEQQYGIVTHTTANRLVEKS